MKTAIKLKHGSNEWLEFRKSGIGGSEAAAILGLSPWKSNIELWEEKTGKADPKDVSNNLAVEYGKKAEEHLTALFRLDHPELRVESPKDYVYKRGFMFASLDGELTDEKGRQGILEIKTTEIFASMAKEKWKDKVPDNYFWQVIHYMIVTDAKFAILSAQLKSTDNSGDLYKRTMEYRFERSELMQEMKYLYLKEKEFWDYVQKGIRPPLILPPL